MAGSILALELIKAGKSIVVIDDSSLSNCSKVAGGIYNPIVFKRLTQSWMAEMVLPAMLDFYTELETKFNTSLVHPVKVARFFENENEETLWKQKSLNELNEFISPDIFSPENGMSFTKSNYSYVKQAGFIDVVNFLKHTRNYLENQNSLVEEKLDYDAIASEGENVVYKNISCSKIIFCEGYLYKENPWFNALPFKPAKGEVLTIHCEELLASSILNKDIFVLPMPERGYFKVGATYNWDDLTDETTPGAKDELEKKLKKLIPYKFKVVKHEAGVRPASIDRRPVMGFHNENRNLGIFNGFGTKGVMLAPYFAKHFCSFMENKTPLWQEVDVKRFY